tara:strand:+ start:70 stop:726 length:657 start_codon:yes stop_codon:yes gene_type:complete
MSKTGYIYKIFCKTDDELVYYGSTTLRVCKRIKQHQYDYNYWKNENNYFATSFLIIDTGDWDYITVENVVYDEPFELRNRERWYIQNNECINKNIPNTTSKESGKKWRDNNKVKLKQYQEDNKEKMKEYQKEYYKQNDQRNKEKHKEYYKQNETRVKEYQKQYREQNGEKIKKRKNEFYQQNKEKIAEKITCECGCVVSRSNLLRHKKSKKHQKCLET